MKDYMEQRFDANNLKMVECQDRTQGDKNHAKLTHFNLPNPRLNATNTMLLRGQHAVDAHEGPG